MKVYTKTGDTGQTGLYGGARVPKDHLRIQAYGTFDELNAALGVILAEPELSRDLRACLSRVQGELFQLGAELATPPGRKTSARLVDEKQVTLLEAEMDQMTETLPELTNFILPAGCRASSLLHLARTICRRAERELVTLARQEEVRPDLIRYANRLSDHLFVCARMANHQAGVVDVPWIAPH